MMARAEASGARILKQAAKTFWGGYNGYFADPDGHVWEIAFNPFWQLDGGRGISALTRTQRWLLLVAVVAAWLLFREGILLVIGAFLVFQCFREAPVREDQGVLLQFGVLIGLLGYLSTVRG